MNPIDRDKPSAVGFLREQLADGPVSAGDLEERAKEQGITPSMLRTAAKRLDVTKRKQGFDGGWEWSIESQGVPF